MGDLILKECRQIYRNSPDRGPSHNSILIRDGKIENIGPITKIWPLAGKGAEVIDCSDLIVLPGFVDSHTHLLFAGTREDELYLRAAGKSYMEILKQGGGIYNTVNNVKFASEELLLKNGLRFLDEALSFGITTIEIKSGYGLDYDNEKKMLKIINKLNKLHPIKVIPTFLVHTVPKNGDRKKYIDQLLNRMIPEFREYAEWFDIFVERGVFETKEAELLIKRSIDEGYRIGIHTNQIEDISGIALADRLGVRHVDHLEVLSDNDAEMIIENKNIYPVFLPAAEGFVFSRHIGQINKLISIPSRIVLSSDFNPGSSPVLSPQFVMTYAVLRYRIPDPLLLIDAYTTNPSEMLFLEMSGKIERGYKADLVCINLENFKQIPYFGTFNFVKIVIKDGIVIWDFKKDFKRGGSNENYNQCFKG